MAWPGASPVAASRQGGRSSAVVQVPVPTAAQPGLENGTVGTPAVRCGSAAPAGVPASVRTLVCRACRAGPGPGRAARWRSRVRRLWRGLRTAPRIRGWSRRTAACCRGRRRSSWRGCAGGRRAPRSRCHPAGAPPSPGRSGGPGWGWTGGPRCANPPVRCAASPGGRSGSSGRPRRLTFPVVQIACRLQRHDASSTLRLSAGRLTHQYQTTYTHVDGCTTKRTWSPFFIGS